MNRRSLLRFISLAPIAGSTSLPKAAPQSAYEIDYDDFIRRIETAISWPSADDVAHNLEKRVRSA